MRKRILLADSDWQLLKYAHGPLRKSGNEVIVESDPSRIPSLIETWKPDVIIAPAEFFQEWEEDYSSNQDILARFPDSKFLITAAQQDTSLPWQRWIMKGHEILLKPIVHYLQLHAAIESALNSQHLQRDRA